MYRVNYNDLEIATTQLDIAIGAVGLIILTEPYFGTLSKTQRDHAALEWIVKE